MYFIFGVNKDTLFTVSHAKFQLISSTRTRDMANLVKRLEKIASMKMAKLDCRKKVGFTKTALALSLLDQII